MQVRLTVIDVQLVEALQVHVLPVHGLNDANSGDVLVELPIYDGDRTADFHKRLSSEGLPDHHRYNEQRQDSQRD